MSFLHEILRVAAARGAKPVLVEAHGSELQQVSGNALLESVARARAFLKGRGVRAGDRVALLGPNSAHWIAVDLAIVAEGAICVPLYARQDPAQLAGMLRDCTPVCLIAADEVLRDAIKLAWPEHAEVALLSDILACAPETSEPGADVGHGVVTIIYTSGTSGEPKGVMLTGESIDFMLRTTVTRLGEMSRGGRDEDVVFHYLPLCFAGSRIMMWSQLYRGNPLTLSTDLTRLAEELSATQPHYFMNVPALLERIRNGVQQKLKDRGGWVYSIYQRALRAASGKGSPVDAFALTVARAFVFPKIKALIGPRIEFLVCGSAPLNEETQRWFALLGIDVLQVYGLTETTAIVTCDHISSVVPGRVGRVIEGCELQVNEEGELLCRGPNLFAGYWNRPDATKQMLVDGWLHTGDLADIDNTGNVRVIGRAKDVLVPESGHNLPPGPIEEKLIAACAGIEHVVLIGHGRPYVTALMFGSANQAAVEAACDAVNQTLPHYMRVRKHIHLSEMLTHENGMLTANQKLKRKVIEARFKTVVDRMYE